MQPGGMAVSATSEPTQCGLPLRGVRVLDLSRLLPGPFGTLVLSELGAQVDKLEDPGAGDYLRQAGPVRAGGEMTVAFAALNRGKRSAVVDLKHPQGREAFMRLLPQYDVLVEQFRPGTLERLGLGHDALRARHPALIVCALTGYGQTGPLRNRAGHDLNYLARAGLLGLQGPAGGAPQTPGVQAADITGGMWCAIAILAALRERDATGVGRVIDIAMTEGALGLGALGLSSAAGGDDEARGEGLLSGGIAPYGTYRCRDDAWVALAALEPKFWLRFAAATGLEAGLEALLPGPHQGALVEAVAAVFAAKTRAEWEAFAETHDCCIEPVLRPGEVMADAHLRARGIVGVTTEVAGTSVPVFRLPVSPDPVDPVAPLPAPPRPGEHTRAILRGSGMSDEAIDALVAEGAIRTSSS